MGGFVTYFRFALLVVLTTGAGACMRNHDEFVVPLGHPADPGARAGAELTTSSTLEPELQTVKPRVGPPSSEQKPAPPSGGHQH